MALAGIAALLTRCNKATARINAQKNQLAK